MNLAALTICMSLLFGCLTSGEYQSKTEDYLGDAYYIYSNPNTSVDNQTLQEKVTLFESKFNRKVLLPKEVPFHTTNIETVLNEPSKTLTVSYRNKESNKTLVITQMVNIKPKSGNKFPVNPHEKEINIKDLKVTYIYDLSEDIPNYVRFMKDDMVYFINFRQFEDANIDGYVKIINSMLSK